MNQLLVHNDSLRMAIDYADDNILKEAVNLNAIDLVLRQCLSMEEMKEAGSFFTGQALATKLVKSFSRAITSESKILDPTCGAGNLLIECSRMLGVYETLSKTISSWGEVLWGFDIHESFIEATKLRLIIEALNRGVIKDCGINDALQYFKNIKVVDTLSITKAEIEEITHVVFNPPFTSWNSPNKYYWKKGKVNAAGIVLDHYLRILEPNTFIAAVLPDVLRSGSRYGDFRDFCSLRMIGSCLPFGRFNSKTDVDVFILTGYRCDKEMSQIKWQEVISSQSKLSDKFDVCIGPLVSYRDELVGDEYPYLHSKNTPSWSTITEFKETRKFKGKLISSPFIVIKRTSSPSDKFRANATLINSKGMVAVENHLIVVKPKIPSIKECKKLMKVLYSQKTNDFLNKTIRMRHLTVQSIKDIPYDD